VSAAASSYRPRDEVRVIRLLVAEREVTGSSATPPQPRVGDWGTVVADVGDGMYLVESRTDDGVALWLAEFSGDELTLIDRPEGAS
jgi:hypothetical protein